jgi:hypothetical protein
MRITEVVSKPLTPSQARVDALKKGVDFARRRLADERKRQKTQRLQQQLVKAQQHKISP